MAEREKEDHLKATLIDMQFSGGRNGAQGIISYVIVLYSDLCCDPAYTKLDMGELRANDIIQECVFLEKHLPCSCVLKPTWIKPPVLPT